MIQEDVIVEESGLATAFGAGAVGPVHRWLGWFLWCVYMGAVCSVLTNHPIVLGAMVSTLLFLVFCLLRGLLDRIAHVA